MEETMQILDLSHFKSKNSLFLQEIFDNAILLKDLTFEKYWESVLLTVQKSRNKNPLFFFKPQWSEIENWLAEKSFKYNICRKYIIKEFDQLAKASDDFYDNSSMTYDYFVMHKLCFNYLNKYQHLTNSLQQNDILIDGLGCTVTFRNMLKTGYILNDKNNDSSKIKKGLFYRFYLPLFLENLCLFYSFIKNDIWHRKKLKDNEMLAQIYKHVIKEKGAHLHFRDVPMLEDCYVSTYYNVDYPYIINRDFLSSIEPIRPVRWIEKVRAYIKRCTEEKKPLFTDNDGNYIIKIVAIGYVYLEQDKESNLLFSNELKMFCETLSALYAKSEGNYYKFKVDILTNDKDDYFQKCNNYISSIYQNVSLTIRKTDYQTLFTPNAGKSDDVIGNIICENDIVLLLDVPNLYTHKYKLLRKSSRDFPDDLKSSYEKEYQSMDFEDTDFLVYKYRYAPINLISSKLNLISMNEDTYEDTLKYCLNLPLIDYLRNYVMRFLKVVILRYIQCRKPRIYAGLRHC